MLSTMLLFILIPVIFIFVLLLPVIAIIDILRSKFEGNDALLMALIVIFIPFGAIVYFFIAPSKKIRTY
ncbi:MAG: PLDc N-terminal domain-containing protein [Paludibacteraceae bacterium]|nr:PLDc N-terminal domain-containing protein [Paludibacteraceae bacterium]